MEERGHPKVPLTSLRIEIIRDGVEDYDALKMLDELLRKKGKQVPAAIRDRARQALAVNPDIYESMTKFPTDAPAMLKQCRAVNELFVQIPNLKSDK